MIWRGANALKTCQLQLRSYELEVIHSSGASLRIRHLSAAYTSLSSPFEALSLTRRTTARCARLDDQPPAQPCPMTCITRMELTQYNEIVERTVRVFGSFEAADEADARNDAAMSSEERLNILLELRDRRHPNATEQRLARVYRVVELERS